MKKFLVFGANGFIGSSIVEELAKDSSVTAIDRYSRAVNFAENSNIHIIKADITQESDLEELFTKKLDGVVWAVGGTIPADELSSSEISQSVKAAIEIFRKTFEKKVPLIFLSSAGMLYKPLESILTEESVVDPWTWYGRQKLELENGLASLAQEYNHQNYQVLRITSVYGERQATEKNQGVIGKLIISALQAKTFTLYGSMKAQRDYIYVKDVARIVKKVFESALAGHIFNISSGKIYTIEEIKLVIEKLSGKKIEIKQEEQRIIDPLCISVSNSKFLKEVGTFDFTNIETGLKNTWEWYKKNL